MDNEQERDRAEESYNARQAEWEAGEPYGPGVEIGRREGDELLDEAAAGRARTAAATAARVRTRLERNAQELRDHGYVVHGPGQCAAGPASPVRHEFSTGARLDVP